MQVLKITDADFAEVLNLNEASVPHVSIIDREQLQWFADNAAFVSVVRIDQRLAGFLIGLRPGTEYASPNYRWFCDHYEDCAYVDRVAVSDWARRQGIAESLYNEFARAQSGAPVMTCEVNIQPPNEGSMLFHHRLGFRQVGTLKSDGGKKEVALLEKKL